MRNLFDRKIFSFFRLLLLGGLFFFLGIFSLNANPLEKKFWEEYQNILDKILLKNQFEYRQEKFIHSGVNYRLLYDPESKSWIERQQQKLNLFDPRSMQKDSPKTILAFWINVYNFYTIVEIKKHYPISSMKKIGWKNPVVLIYQQELSLDDVEHKIIRPMKDPRIHFAINCASVSCPSLHDKIFEGDLLDQQLDFLVANALKNPLNLRIIPSFWGKDKMGVTKILSWFDEDFGSNRDIVAFIHRYAPPSYGQFQDYSTIGYDWNLNSQKNIQETLDALILKLRLQ